MRGKLANVGVFLLKIEIFESYTLIATRFSRRTMRRVALDSF